MCDCDINVYTFCRKYYNPTPDIRAILDSVSNLVYTIKSSLKKGITRYNKLRIEFRSDVFRFLFGGKGKDINKRKGREYSKDDFDESYFAIDWFKCYNIYQECSYIDFPIIMYTYIKYSPLTYIKTDAEFIECNKDFKEMVYVVLVKKRSVSCLI